MRYRMALFILCNLSYCVTSFAQWTKEDSLWMEDVKSGKIKIELSPEAKKAIEEGRLLRFEKEDIDLQRAESQLPILKEFENIQPEEKETEPMDITKLPPSIFLRRDIPDTAHVNSFVYVGPQKNYITMKVIPIGTTGFYITAHTGDLNPIVKDGQSRGGALLGVGYCFSMEDILRYIFWPSERAKRRNSKYATAWKNY